VVRRRGGVAAVEVPYNVDCRWRYTIAVGWNKCIRRQHGIASGYLIAAVAWLGVPGA
jgi:hypothetical protein